MAPTLYKATRVCCDCGAEVPSGRRQQAPGGVNLVSITPLIYRRGNGKGQLKNAHQVVICETCLIKSITSGRLGWISTGESKLWTALKQSLTDRYNSLLEADRA